MVHLKSTSLAMLLGSAALSSAAVLPSMHKPEARHPSSASPSKREWKGKLGARGPWRQENDHYVSAFVYASELELTDQLINVDLTGDGPHHNGHGDLLDINTRDLPLPLDKDVLRRELKSYMQSTEPVIVIGSDSHEVPADPLADLNVAAALQERDDRLLSLAARLIIGSGELTPSARDVDLGNFESAAKDAGVTDDQMAEAKNAIEGMSPEQKAEVENAVKHAMFTVVKPGEKKRKVPGPAYLFKKSNDGAMEKLKQGGNVKVTGGEEPKDTGVLSMGGGEQHGAPLLAQPNKRSIADEMGGAPGYIDITSPVFNSTATRLASLVLSTSNGTSENSTFVLNASSSVRTQVFLVPINSTEGDAKDGDMIQVNLKVPVFVAESAAVEPFCATFDPAPDAPESMTVEPCAEPEDERSQIFLFDPETGAVKPKWTPTEANQQLLAKVSDSISSEIPLPTSTLLSSAISASALPTVSVSASMSAVDFAATASAPDINMMAASLTESALDTLPTDAVPDALASLEPLESADPTDWEEDAIPTSTEDWATAAALAAESSIPSAPISEAAIPSDMPSALPTPALSSIAPEALVTAFAASHSAAIPSASALPVPAPQSSGKSSGNNVTLIFTPSNASVQSSDDPAEPAKAGKGKREMMGDDGDCDDTPTEIFAFAAPAGALPSAAHASAAHASGSAAHPSASAVRSSSAAAHPAASASSSAKPKAKSPKLPEGAPTPSDAGSKVKVVQGDVQVDNVQGLAGRLTVKREQKVMMAPQSGTAPYEWTWTSVEDAEKEPEETVKVFAALAARD